MVAWACVSVAGTAQTRHVCAQGVSSGFCVPAVTRAKLCVQPRVCRKSRVQSAAGSGPVHTFPLPPLPPAATSFLPLRLAFSSLLPVSSSWFQCLRQPSPSILRAGLGGTGGFVNSVWSGLDPSTPGSLGRRGAGGSAEGLKKALAY